MSGRTTVPLSPDGHPRGEGQRPVFPHSTVMRCRPILGRVGRNSAHLGKKLSHHAQGCGRTSMGGMA